MATRQEKQKAAIDLVRNGLFLLVVGGAMLYLIVMAGAAAIDGRPAGLIMILVVLALVLLWKLPTKNR